MTKRFLFLMFFSLFAHHIFADAITDFEKWQADKMLSYLSSESFIFPFCDCCDKDKLQIVQIENVSIEAANEKLYSVRVKGKIITVFETDILGNAIDSEESGEFFNELISINYTFVGGTNKAFSLGEILNITNVDGYDITRCQPFMDIPVPSLVNNSLYENWYFKHVPKEIDEKELIGTWKISAGYDAYMEEIKQEADEPSVYLTFHEDGRCTVTGSDSYSKWSIVEGLLNLEPVEQGEDAAQIPFYITKNKEMYWKVQFDEDSQERNVVLLIKQ